MTREKALENYNNNPKRCLLCNKIIQVRETENPADTRKKKFCDITCAVRYNSKKRTKKESITCKCGDIKDRSSKTCLKCYKNNNIGNKTLGYYIAGKKFLSSKCQSIRKDVRRILEMSNKEKVCPFCKSNEFTSILEVHHIKGILEFSHDTTISCINDENNLTWICPNHHVMLEKNLIKYEVVV